MVLYVSTDLAKYVGIGFRVSQNKSTDIHGRVTSNKHTVSTCLVTAKRCVDSCRAKCVNITDSSLVLHTQSFSISDDALEFYERK